MKTFALLLAAAAAGSVLAACPNQCSGHGRCTENDICECYKQTGTTWRQRVGYTGADCSQRTCPLGIAYDMLSTNRGVEVEPVKFTAGSDFTGAANTQAAPAAAGSLKVFAKAYAMGETKTFHVRISQESDLASAAEQIMYQWKLDEHAAYSAPVPLVTAADATTSTGCTAVTPCELVDNGDNTAVTGMYIYADAAAGAALSTLAKSSAATGFQEGNVFTFTYDHQEGRVYEYGSSNNAHQQIECSGRGSCDAETGRCACQAGFSGEACQRTVCPNDCSGHGVCQSLKRFATDAAALSATASYAAAYDADKQMGCMCDDGFRGPDCSLVECPSSDDPMGYFGGDGLTAAGAAGPTGPGMDCSGRGLCDYTTGTCDCFLGYVGEACTVQTNFV